MSCLTKGDMGLLKNKIPPVLVVALYLAVMFGLTTGFPQLRFQLSYHIPLASLLLIIALLIITMAVLAFRKAQTTVDPTQPENASKLVCGGIFSVTRNPMYLGMALLLIAAGIYWQHIAALVLALSFPLYLTCFQILPEEQAMAKLFPAQWPDYKKRVRRWI